MTNGKDSPVGDAKGPVTTISITGGTGFIGRHLVKALSDLPGLELIALTRSLGEEAKLPQASNLRWLQGDIEDSETLRRLLVTGGRLIHLAYPVGWDSRRHLEATGRLARVAAELGLTRVVLCSTAVVVGRAASHRIIEDTACIPLSDYERTKIGIEQTFRDLSGNAYQLAVLRPTAVLGPDGLNLVKLAGDLTQGRPFINYLRSSLYGRRRMHLVCVDNVVAALEFLVRREQIESNEVYIVSDDDDPKNNFRTIETELMRHLVVPNYPLPPLPVPQWLLAAILRLSSRSCTDPERIYDGSRLVRAGYRKVSTLTQSLECFCARQRQRRQSTSQKQP